MEIAHLVIWRNLSVIWRKILILLAEAIMVSPSLYLDPGLYLYSVHISNPVRNNGARISNRYLYFQISF